MIQIMGYSYRSLKVLSVLFLFVKFSAVYAQHVHFDDYKSIYKKRFVGDKTHILYIGGGDYHDDLRKASELRKFLEVEHGYFVTYTEDYDVFTNGLKQYDLILLNTKLNRLTDKQYNAFLKAIKQGMPLLAVHGASASFRNTSPVERPEYYKMIGAKFDHHPKMHKFRLKLVEENNLIDATYANFDVIDELYYYSQFEEDNRVLLTASYQGESSPMTWVRNYGKGRVFYTALGHSPAVSANPNFQKLILFGVEWCLNTSKM